MTEVRAETQNSPHRWLPTFLILFSVFSIGIILSFGWLLRDPANSQEQSTVALSTRPVTSIYKEASSDDPMPVYYLLTHYLANHGLGGLVALRLLSLLCFLFIPGIAYLIVRLVVRDRRAGWLAILLTGFSPFLLWFGNRATVYSMLALVTFANQYFFARVLLKKRAGWTGYILTGLLGLGIHYFFAMVLLTQAIFWAVKWRSRSIKSNIFMAVALISFGLGFGIWVHQTAAIPGQLWSQLPYNTVKPSATNIFILLVQYLFGFQSVLVTTLTMALWPLLAVLALLAIQKYVRLSEVMQYFALAAVMPILAIFIISWLWRPLFLVSYLIICTPACLLLVSRYLTAFNLAALKLARYGLVVAVIFSLFWEVMHPVNALQEDYLGSVSSTHISFSKILSKIKIR